MSNEDMGLPQLDGTDPQVAWAISLRHKFLSRLVNVGDQVSMPYGAIVSAVEEFCIITDAQWWINNKAMDLAVYWQERAAYLKPWMDRQRGC